VDFLFLCKRLVRAHLHSVLEVRRPVNTGGDATIACALLLGVARIEAGRVTGVIATHTRLLVEGCDPIRTGTAASIGVAVTEATELPLTHWDAGVAIVIPDATGTNRTRVVTQLASLVIGGRNADAEAGLQAGARVAGALCFRPVATRILRIRRNVTVIRRRFVGSAASYVGLIKQTATVVHGRFRGGGVGTRQQEV
jgi:hypothetical protein